MELYVPCTIDLRKHQTTDKRYGLEHINKLLEQELSQLRALKNQQPKEVLLPTVKNTNQKNSEVEGLKNYQRRVEQNRSRGCRLNPEEKPMKHNTSNIAPFSEMSNDFQKDKRVIGKGEMPFFQLSSDGHSLPSGLPRLLETRTEKTGNYIKLQKAHETTNDNQRLKSKSSERSKQLSRKLVRSSVRIKPDLSTDSSDYEERLTNSLRIQYCSMAVRDSIQQETREKSRRTLIRDDHNNKTFHLACTREPVKYKAAEKDEDDCTFCASSVFLRSRRPQNGDGKSQDMRDSKALAMEKTFLPRIEKEISEKSKMVGEPCEKCRKRSVQAEQNRTAIANASSSRKREFKNVVIERKAKSRPVTKEQVDPPLPPSKQEIVLPLLEYTAYMDQDGSLFLLPGAFTLCRKDYNIWSRKGKSNDTKHITSQTTSLPNLVN